MVFGKNTMVRRCIRDLTSDGSHPEWAAIVPVMKGNLGFMFTNGDLGELQTVQSTWHMSRPHVTITPNQCLY